MCARVCFRALPLLLLIVPPPPPSVLQLESIRSQKAQSALDMLQSLMDDTVTDEEALENIHEVRFPPILQRLHQQTHHFDGICRCTMRIAGGLCAH